MEKNIELEVCALLPGINCEDDSCIKRLEQSLMGHKDLTRAHLQRENNALTLCLHYDPERVDLPQVKRLAERAGAQIVSRYRHDVIDLEGMDCADCALVIQHSLNRVDGVLTASASYPLKKVRVEYDTHQVNRAALEKRIQALGYTIPARGLTGWYRTNQELLFSLFSGLLLLTGWLGGLFLGFPVYLSIALYALAYGVGGWDVAHHAWGSLRTGSFNTDLLMVVAALGAASLGDFVEGGLLIFLFSLGHALEERALDKARSAISALSTLAPKTALVRRGQLELDIPVEEVLAGEIVIVRPGVRLPADGVVTHGESSIDQAPITGESIPVEKQAGDAVFAGTINGAGALEVRVIRPTSDSTLARVMKMVEEAQTQKSPTQQTVERFMRVFVPAVLIVTGLVIAVPPLFGVPFRVSFLRAMTLLVAASPCALALGTPSAVLSAVAQAARSGVLVKGGLHLENLGRIKALALDKTGTLTHGRPEVTDVVPLDEIEEDELLQLAARVENRSAHPLAAAIVRAAQTRGLELTAVEGVESVTGLGLRAAVDGLPVWIGNQKWMQEAGVPVSESALAQIEALQAAGSTLILAARENKLLGILALADTLRPDVPPAVARLKRLGVREIALLTGDQRAAAEAVARQAGVTQVYAGLLPEQKLDVIRELLQRWGTVAMVGDGVNDAPALAYATVGIAMGGAATAVALETADVALMGDDLGKLPFAIGLGKATRAIILQNLCIALGVILVLAGASLAGLAGIGVAVIFHEGSTLVVALNSLRLLAYRPADL